jgi:hypothetical protein
MADDMTPEDALAMLDKVKGPDGLRSLKSALEKAIVGRKISMAAAQGELTAFMACQRMVESMEDHLGLSDTPKVLPADTAIVTPTPVPASTPAPVVKAPEPISPPEPDPELVARVKAGLCQFKDRRPPHGTGKWCARKLTTKSDQSCGFCKIHQKALGMKSGARNAKNAD